MCTRVETEYEISGKTLRLCDADLKVIIGSDTNEAYETRSNRTVRMYHSIVLASRSKYIDTMLSTGMKEHHSREISFPDISIETWDKMMMFLEDLTMARKMTIDDAILCAPFYDKYEFREGHKLCNLILAEYFDSIKTENKIHSDLNKLIDAALVAMEHHLKNAEKKGASFLWNMTQSPLKFSGRMMLTKKLMQKMVPILAANTMLQCGNDHYTKEALTDPSFPELFVLRTQNKLQQEMISGLLMNIQVFGTNCGIDGYYIRSKENDAEFVSKRRNMYDGEYVQFKICRLEDDWVIYHDEHEDPIICWKSPLSENMPLPPRKNWTCMSRFATGNPEIRYIWDARFDLDDEFY